MRYGSDMNPDQPFGKLATRVYKPPAQTLISYGSEDKITLRSVDWKL